MRVFYFFWFFILWLNMNESLQQNAQQCPLIHVDQNVQVIGHPERARSGSVVRFRCKSSSEVLEGSAVTHCDENGEWSGIVPRCTAIKCTAPVIENGFVLGGIQEYNEHEFLNFQCDRNYKRADDRLSKCIKVGTKAEWSPTPACEAMKCELILPAPKGTRYEPAFRKMFSSGDTVRVLCGENHWIVNHQTTSAETTCQSNGVWSIRPLCQEVLCSNQRDPLVDWWGVYRYHRMKLGDIVYYRCKRDYHSTSNHATCTRDGWAPKPLCRGTSCIKLHIENAEITYNNKNYYSYNEQVQYTCRNGNESTLTITCREGVWTGVKSCSAYCDKLNNERQSMNFTSDKDRYMDGDVIQYQCVIPDAAAEGNATCVNGKWIKTVECTALGGCGKPPPLADGDTKESVKFQYSHNDKVEYLCQNYYLMEGEPFMTCSNGEWTGQMRCLKPCTVDKAVMSRHNIMFRNSNAEKLYVYHNDLINFVCIHGSPVGTLEMHQKCVDGEIKLPTCQ